MTKYTGDGRAITKQAREDIARAGVMMSVEVLGDHLPNEYRSRFRKERLSDIHMFRAQAEAALEEWAKAEVADATTRRNENSVGTAAEETRRNTEEIRIGRLVDNARASGNPKGAAGDLAARADQAMISGDRDGAMVLGRAVQELGGVSGDLGHLVDEIVKTVALDRELADPAKARAIKDLVDVDVVVAAFRRDIAAVTAGALQDGIALARAIGEHAEATKLSKEVAEASIRAKVEASIVAEKTGMAYSEPIGALPGIPTNIKPTPEVGALPDPNRSKADLPVHS